jgi:glucose/arabinose dehydrogenase
MRIDSRFRFINIVIPLWLAACGGGGGSDVTAPAPTPAPTPAPGPAPVPPPAGGPAPSPGPDTQAPTVTLTAPLEAAANVTGTLAITATATDNVAVASVEFQVDGIPAGAADTTAPYAASVDTTLFTSGQHVVRARSADAAGNHSPWDTATVSFGGTRTQPAGFTRLESWVSGLVGATAIAQAADGRFFVAQQTGELRVVKNGLLLSTPFTQIAVDSNGERGLIGVTLHPAFATNHWVYVYYTSTTGGSHNRISRFTASGDVAAAGSEEVLVNLTNLSTATNHNGGAIHFGKDGKLYVGVGDNANGVQAQDLSSVFGKVLRFNEDGSIPPDGPFATTSPGNASAIWAYGLRNPFTFAVQPGTGTIHINDVGENTWEEIDVAAKGANYGWPNSEGPTGVTTGIVGPVFTYNHTATTPPGTGLGGFFTGAAIAGGTFYPATGGTFPAAYAGNYFFSDFGSKFVARYDLTNNAVYKFGQLSGNPVDMITGVDTSLYVLTRDAIAKFSAP